MAEHQQNEIDIITNTIEKAIYGKEVRSSIANGIRLCYKYADGEAALEAADQARREVATLSLAVEESVDVVDELRRKTESVDDLVIISQDQPTSPDNKIWIRPQADREFKVATYDAYVALWDRMNSFDDTYGPGHGGIVNVEKDNNYSNPSDALERKYTIHYADGSTGAFFVHDGPQGIPGPVDDVREYDVHFLREASLTRNPSTGKIVVPVTGWVNDMPDIVQGHYLWTQTVLTYASGEVGYLYNVTYQGTDGSGTVNSIQLGNNQPILPNDRNIVIELDTSPTFGNTTHLMSSDAIQRALSDVLTGDVPTRNVSDSSQKIASTAFVHAVVEDAEKKFTGKRFSVLGDSISSFVGVMSEDIVSMGGEAFYPMSGNAGNIETDSDIWWGQLAAKTGMSLLINDSFSGNRLFNYADPGATGWDTWYNRVKSGNTIPDYIFIYLGVNDWGSNVPVGEWNDYSTVKTSRSDFSVGENQTFANACAYVLYTLASLYKQTKIYCCTFPEPYGNFTTFAPTNSFPRLNTAMVNAAPSPTSAAHFNRIIRDITKSLGVGLIDLRRYVGYNFFTESANTYTIDGLHPNKSGMERIAEVIARTII